MHWNLARVSQRLRKLVVRRTSAAPVLQIKLDLFALEPRLPQGQLLGDTSGAFFAGGAFGNALSLFGNGGTGSWNFVAADANGGGGTLDAFRPGGGTAMAAQALAYFGGYGMAGGLEQVAQSGFATAGMGETGSGTSGAGVGGSGLGAAPAVGSGAFGLNDPLIGGSGAGFGAAGGTVPAGLTGANTVVDPATGGTAAPAPYAPATTLPGPTDFGVNPAQYLADGGNLSYLSNPATGQTSGGLAAMQRPSNGQFSTQSGASPEMLGLLAGQDPETAMYGYSGGANPALVGGGPSNALGAIGARTDAGFSPLIGLAGSGLAAVLSPTGDPAQAQSPSVPLGVAAGQVGLTGLPEAGALSPLLNLHGGSVTAWAKTLSQPQLPTALTPATPYTFTSTTTGNHPSYGPYFLSESGTGNYVLTLDASAHTFTLVESVTVDFHLSRTYYAPQLRSWVYAGESVLTVTASGHYTSTGFTVTDLDVNESGTEAVAVSASPDNGATWTPVLNGAGTFSVDAARDEGGWWGVWVEKSGAETYSLGTNGSAAGSSFTLQSDGAADYAVAVHGLLGHGFYAVSAGSGSGSGSSSGSGSTSGSGSSSGSGSGSGSSSGSGSGSGSGTGSGSGSGTGSGSGLGSSSGSGSGSSSGSGWGSGSGLWGFGSDLSLASISFTREGTETYALTQSGSGEENGSSYTFNLSSSGTQSFTITGTRLLIDDDVSLGSLTLQKTGRETYSYDRTVRAGAGESWGGESFPSSAPSYTLASSGHGAFTVTAALRDGSGSFDLASSGFAGTAAESFLGGNALAVTGQYALSSVTLAKSGADSFRLEEWSGAGANSSHQVTQGRNDQFRTDARLVNGSGSFNQTGALGAASASGYLSLTSVSTDRSGGESFTVTESGARSGTSQSGVTTAETYERAAEGRASFARTGWQLDAAGSFQYSGPGAADRIESRGTIALDQYTVREFGGSESFTLGQTSVRTAGAATQALSQTSSGAQSFTRDGWGLSARNTRGTGYPGPGPVDFRYADGAETVTIAGRVEARQLAITRTGGESYTGIETRRTGVSEYANGVSATGTDSVTVQTEGRVGYTRELTDLTASGTFALTRTGGGGSALAVHGAGAVTTLRQTERNGYESFTQSQEGSRAWGGTSNGVTVSGTRWYDNTAAGSNTFERDVLAVSAQGPLAVTRTAPGLSDELDASGSVTWSRFSRRDEGTLVTDTSGGGQEARSGAIAGAGSSGSSFDSYTLGSHGTRAFHTNTSSTDAAGPGAVLGTSVRGLLTSATEFEATGWVHTAGFDQTVSGSDSYSFTEDGHSTVTAPGDDSVMRTTTETFAYSYRDRSRPGGGFFQTSAGSEWAGNGSASGQDNAGVVAVAYTGDPLYTVTQAGRSEYEATQTYQSWLTQTEPGGSVVTHDTDYNDRSGASESFSLHALGAGGLLAAARPTAAPTLPAVESMTVTRTGAESYTYRSGETLTWDLVRPNGSTADGTNRKTTDGGGNSLFTAAMAGQTAAGQFRVGSATSNKSGSDSFSYSEVERAAWHTVGGDSFGMGSPGSSTGYDDGTSGYTYTSGGDSSFAAHSAGGDTGAGYALTSFARTESGSDSYTLSAVGTANWYHGLDTLGSWESGTDSYALERAGDGAFSETTEGRNIGGRNAVTRYTRTEGDENSLFRFEDEGAVFRKKFPDTSGSYDASALTYHSFREGSDSYSMTVEGHDEGATFVVSNYTRTDHAEDSASWSTRDGYIDSFRTSGGGGECYPEAGNGTPSVRRTQETFTESTSGTWSSDAYVRGREQAGTFVIESFALASVGDETFTFSRKYREEWDQNPSATQYDRGLVQETVTSEGSNSYAKFQSGADGAGGVFRLASFTLGQRGWESFDYQQSGWGKNRIPYGGWNTTGYDESHDTFSSSQRGEAGFTVVQRGLEAAGGAFSFGELRLDRDGHQTFTRSQEATATSVRETTPGGESWVKTQTWVKLTSDGEDSYTLAQNGSTGTGGFSFGLSTRTVHGSETASLGLRETVTRHRPVSNGYGTVKTSHDVSFTSLTKDGASGFTVTQEWAGFQTGPSYQFTRVESTGSETYNVLERQSGNWTETVQYPTAATTGWGSDTLTRTSRGHTAFARTEYERRDRGTYGAETVTSTGARADTGWETFHLDASGNVHRTPSATQQNHDTYTLSKDGRADNTVGYTFTDVNGQRVDGVQTLSQSAAETLHLELNSRAETGTFTSAAGGDWTKSATDTTRDSFSSYTLNQVARVLTGGGGESGSVAMVVMSGGYSPVQLTNTTEGRDSYTVHQTVSRSNRAFEYGSPRADVWSGGTTDRSGSSTFAANASGTLSLAGQFVLTTTTDRAGRESYARSSDGIEVPPGANPLNPLLATLFGGSLADAGYSFAKIVHDGRKGTDSFHLNETTKVTGTVTEVLAHTLEQSGNFTFSTNVRVAQSAGAGGECLPMGMESSGLSSSLQTVNRSGTETYSLRRVGSDVPNPDTGWYAPPFRFKASEVRLEVDRSDSSNIYSVASQTSGPAGGTVTLQTTVSNTALLTATEENRMKVVVTGHQNDSFAFVTDQLTAKGDGWAKHETRSTKNESYTNSLSSLTETANITTTLSRTALNSYALDAAGTADGAGGVTLTKYDLDLSGRDSYTLDLHASKTTTNSGWYAQANRWLGLRATLGLYETQDGDGRRTRTFDLHARGDGSFTLSRRGGYEGTYTLTRDAHDTFTHEEHEGAGASLLTPAVFRTEKGGDVTYTLSESGSATGGVLIPDQRTATRTVTDTRTDASQGSRPEVKWTDSNGQQRTLWPATQFNASATERATFTRVETLSGSTETRQKSVDINASLTRTYTDGFHTPSVVSESEVRSYTLSDSSQNPPEFGSGLIGGALGAGFEWASLRSVGASGPAWNVSEAQATGALPGANGSGLTRPAWSAQVGGILSQALTQSGGVLSGLAAGSSGGSESLTEGSYGAPGGGKAGPGNGDRTEQAWPEQLIGLVRKAGLGEVGAYDTLQARVAVLSGLMPGEFAPTPPPQKTWTGDIIKDLSNLSAGWADKLTFGLTGEIRKGFGYDDVVDRGSGAYSAGQAIGGVHQMFLTMGGLGLAAQSSNAIVRLIGNAGQAYFTAEGVKGGIDKIRDGDIVGGLVAIGGTAIGMGVARGTSICSLSGWQKAAAYTVIGGTAAGSVVIGAQGITQIINGDYAGGITNLMDAGSNLFMISRLKACFVAGTPILTPGGWKPIEEIQPDELVLSRSEHDRDGPVRPRAVLATFVRQSPVLNLHARGRIIGTTGEHPFWVESKGWTPASDLRIGDVLVSHDGQRIEVEGVADSGRVETVYNFEVDEDHTYFVGSEQWGWDVWAHNAPKYHGTDEDSARDIENNGLSRKKWQKHIDEHGGDDSGLSLTDSLDDARKHAAKAAAVTGKKGAVLEADDANLPPLKTGDGTEGFDPGESKIMPKDFKKVGPGVFKTRPGETGIPPSFG